MLLRILFLSIMMLGPTSVQANTDATTKTSKEQEKVFAQKLVDAARAQAAALVIYDPSYRKLDYPMGDVPWYVGVCTDVVVRAYRELGIDLQPLIHKARVGSGDRNIDHRRVVVMKKFFKRFGTSLPVSKKPEDYKPGDLVTYHLPDGTFSKTHIAIVSDRKTWSGIPMVIHNRGFGVQEEDWLFAAKITGHFRYKRAPNIAGFVKK